MRNDLPSLLFSFHFRFIISFLQLSMTFLTGSPRLPRDISIGCSSEARFPGTTFLQMLDWVFGTISCTELNILLQRMHPPRWTRLRRSNIGAMGMLLHATSTIGAFCIFCCCFCIIFSQQQTPNFVSNNQINTPQAPCRCGNEGARDLGHEYLSALSLLINMASSPNK